MTFRFFSFFSMQFFLLVVLLFSLPQLPAAAEPVEAWTGRHTRLVWLQDHGNGSDTLAHGRNLLLYGYDSRDGRGERPLVSEAGGYFKPLFTPDGQAVVYSDRQARQMYLLDWQSGKRSELGSGVAVAVWQGPGRGLLRRKTTWVYCFSGPQPENKYGTSQPLYRFPLDQPEKKELIWDKTNLAWDNIQLSRDGRLLGGLFPWPDAGVLWTAERRWQRFGKGCWTSLSPDNSGLLWVFDGLHRNIQVYQVNSGENWQVNINGAPEVGGWEVYHPRWSNHPRYFVVTGPYEKGEGGNRIGGGGEKVEIFIGRFSPDIRKVESWFQLSRNQRADFFPDLWLAGGEGESLAQATAAGDGPVAAERPAADSLVFVWEDMQAANQLDEQSPIGFYQSSLRLRGQALPSRHFQLATGGGWAETGDAGARFGPAIAASGQLSLELILTPTAGQRGEVLSLAGSGGPLLRLVQEGEELRLDPAGGEGGKPLSWPGLLVAGQPRHLLLTVGEGRLELFVDGASQGKESLALSFADQPINRFTLGDPAGGWHGLLEGIAVYDRVLDQAEVVAGRQALADRLVAKSPLPRLVVNGRLAEHTAIPDPENIGAYSRALVVNSYAVEEVVEGEYAEKRLVVAEWAVLDRQVVREYRQPAPSERLVLERFADQPQLEGERQLMDIFEPDLDLYYRLPPSLGG